MAERQSLVGKFHAPLLPAVVAGALAGALLGTFLATTASSLYTAPTVVVQGSNAAIQPNFLPRSRMIPNVVGVSRFNTDVEEISNTQAGSWTPLATMAALSIAFVGFGLRLLSRPQPKVPAELFAIVAASATKGKKGKWNPKAKKEKKEKPPPPVLPPRVVMAKMRKGVLRRNKKPTKTTGRVCALLGKVDNRKARQISFSHIRTKRLQKVNLQWKRLYWEEAKVWVRLRLSTKGLKTVTRYGLHQAAVKFGLDLTKHINGTSERKYVKYLPEKEKKLALIRGARSRYLAAVRWAKLNDETVPEPPAGLQLLKPRVKKEKKVYDYKKAKAERAATKAAAAAAEPATIAMAISHGKRVPRLGRPADQRKALLRSLTTELIRHGRIMTTMVKAKALRKHVDHMITLAKGGSLHERRQALAYIYDKDLVKTLFEQVPDRYSAREGGYTRIQRTMPRKGDCASMCYIELV